VSAFERNDARTIEKTNYPPEMTVIREELLQPESEQSVEEETSRRDPEMPIKEMVKIELISPLPIVARSRQHSIGTPGILSPSPKESSQHGSASKNVRRQTIDRMQAH